jgi:hypothetical protein
VVVIGGLVTATTLTLVLLPILYDRFAPPPRRATEATEEAAPPGAADATHGAVEMRPPVPPAPSNDVRAPRGRPETWLAG